MERHTAGTAFEHAQPTIMRSQRDGYFRLAEVIGSVNVVVTFPTEPLTQFHTFCVTSGFDFLLVNKCMHKYIFYLRFNYLLSYFLYNILSQFTYFLKPIVNINSPWFIKSDLPKGGKLKFNTTWSYLPKG